MTLRFGTDGVRGIAYEELTVELVAALGRAAAGVLGSDRFVVGRDTRVSGPALQAALSAGLAAEGVTVIDAGVLPSPAIAHACASMNIPGAVVSASHNPYADNGVKLFAAGGRKLDDPTQERIEARLPDMAADVAPASPVEANPAIRAAYLAHLLSTLDGRRLEGLRIVLDCANGAAAGLAPDVFAAAGARVEVLGNSPDGININAGCGSTHPASVQRAVVEAGADGGLAFDGDADRVVAVGHDGTVVDGDHILALCAIDRKDRGVLTGDTVVVTVMSNLGLRRSMDAHGIHVHETAVGDRFVLEALETGRWSLGGEQSGHVIFRDLATTGDGLLTGLQLLDLVQRQGRPLAELATEAMTALPQVLRNVRVEGRAADVAKVVDDDVRAAEAELGERGRILIRPSGTEPLVRVMVEATSEELAATVADRLAAAVARATVP